ncbi:rod shape-determining protein MreD [Planococcus lenghuensis]|uniref:Rod shape-determining protein MreD n=1 Tax=Planococcus lenghuensis TaxID=2213202 RepID=A0A1Q2KXI4_9BACL|nr:rod shape-determining protein MreD [Planococcus lenghuensis]AQQ52899.1 rod shape-determining protein MreD [Planococcus lenghuensis]
MNRALIPLILLLLFFIEPIFTLFSPFRVSDEFFIIVPRFVLIFLMMIAIYADRMHAVLWGFVFGVMHDVFFIDIVGLYALFFPVAALVASFTASRFDDRPIIGTAIGFGILVAFEVVLYGVFLLIGFTSMPVGEFLVYRLFPTALMNGLLLFGVAFTLFRSRARERSSKYQVGSFR